MPVNNDELLLWVHKMLNQARMGQQQLEVKRIGPDEREFVTEFTETKGAKTITRRLIQHAVFPQESWMVVGNPGQRQDGYTLLQIPASPTLYRFVTNTVEKGASLGQVYSALLVIPPEGIVVAPDPVADAIKQLRDQGISTGWARQIVQFATPEFAAEALQLGKAAWSGRSTVDQVTQSLRIFQRRKNPVNKKTGLYETFGFECTAETADAVDRVINGAVAYLNLVRQQRSR